MAYSYDRRAARPIPIDKAALRKLADKAVRLLPKHLKFRSDDMDGPLGYARGFRPDWGFFLGVYETTDVRGGEVVVSIKVKAKASLGGWSGPRRWVAGGLVRAIYDAGPRGQGVGYGQKVGLILNINTLASPQDLLDNISGVAKELYSVLIHEVTHLRDLLRHQSPAAENTPETEAHDYYNTPTEVRGFMQQVVDEVLDYAEDVARKMGAWGLHLDTDFVDRALEQSATWERIRKALTPRNTKLILRAVSRALTDEIPKLKKKYPDDDGV